MNNILLILVKIIHILYILFVIVVPFTNSNYLLTLYCIIIPFMVLHWILNNNICALTLVEKYLRKKINGNNPNNDIDCFTCKLIEPVYDFTNNYKAFSIIIYIITFILWFIAASKLFYRWRSGQIKNIWDLISL